MKYLFAMLSLLLLLSGCSTTYHSLTDRFKDKVLSSFHRPEASDTSSPSTSSEPEARPHIPTIESIQASCGESAHLDRF